MNIKVYLDSPNARLPTKSINSDQCIDFYAAEDVWVGALETEAVSLGLRVELPTGYGLEFRERSGLALKGIMIGGGIIDNSYRGTLKAIVRYLAPRTRDPFKISVGDKIVQAELVPTIPINISEIKDFEINSERGERGFGSTG